MTSYRSRESPSSLPMTSSWKWLYQRVSSFKEESEHFIAWRNDAEMQACKPRTNLAFVKTHKTGSTTLATIINRFGFSHGLSFLYNKKNSHGHFTELKLEAERLLPPLCVRDGEYRKYRDYNLMTAHFRLLPNLNNVRVFLELEALAEDFIARRGWVGQFIRLTAHDPEDRIDRQTTK